MKKLLFSIAVMSAMALNAQKKFTDYNAVYWPDKTTYDVEVSEDRGELGKVYIDVHTMDTIHNSGNIIVPKKKLPEFIDFMNEIKAKYVEWTKTAKDNNVTDLNKPIEVSKKLSSEVAFLYGSKWQFTSARLNPKFIADKKGTYLAIMTDELQSSSNQFMKMDGLALVFSSEQEIKEFIEKLDSAKMESFIKGISDKKDLFK